MTTLSLRHAATRHHAGLFSYLSLGLSMRRQRAKLALLEDHLLRDIGLTRAEAQAEAQRPVWDAPAHWTR